MNVQLDTDLTQGPALGVQLLRAHVHGATVTTAYSVHRSLGRRPADLGGLNDDDLGWPAGCRSSTWSWCCLALIAGVSRRLGEAVDPARARKALELVLAGVLDLEIRSLKEADRSSGDEHLPGLREGSDTGDCMHGDAADVAGLALDLARVDAGADQQPVVLGAVANCGGAPDSARRTVEEGQEAVARGRDLPVGPFTALVTKVVTREPYASAKRVFWIVDNGASHRGWTAAARLCDAFPTAVMIHTPVHASWLNQIEIYF
jgi:hypothetical protein